MNENTNEVVMETVETEIATVESGDAGISTGAKFLIGGLGALAVVGAVELGVRAAKGIKKAYAKCKTKVETIKKSANEEKQQNSKPAEEANSEGSNSTEE